MNNKMGKLSQFFKTLSDQDQNQDQDQDLITQAVKVDNNNEKEKCPLNYEENHSDDVSMDQFPGVQKAEAAVLVWSKPALYSTYAWIWICFFMLALHSSISGTVMSYAYADFGNAPQVSTAGMLSSIIGGVLKLPCAKILSIWGRTEGFLLFVGVYVLGIIILAACNNPDSYAAGYVLYWIGYTQIYLIMDVFIADTSGLRNRAFAFAFASTPFICTAFTGPLAGQSFLDHSTWRWGYGAFAIIMPFVLVPLALVFKFYEKKAIKLGVVKKEKSGRTAMQSFIHYFHEFDIVGCFLLMAAFVIFLLPFTLASYGRSQYSSATFIAMVIVGFCIFPVFFLWERFGARKHFIRWELLSDRTVLGACCLSAISFFSFYCWDLYFFQFVSVVYDLNESMAGYMLQIYNVGSCFWGVVFGVWVRYVKHFKYTCLFFGLPLMILGAGLMIHFRGQHENIGYIVMCQIFIAFGGGTLVIGEDMAVMCVADIDGVPMMLALIGLFSSIGGAIGQAVSAAIYTNSFPQRLYDNLPNNMKANATEIYMQGYILQQTFPMGSDVRDAINNAWGYSQRNGCIATTAILALAIPSIAVWRNYNVDKKNKGVVL